MVFRYSEHIFLNLIPIILFWINIYLIYLIRIIILIFKQRKIAFRVQFINLHLDKIRDLIDRLQYW